MSLFTVLGFILGGLFAIVVKLLALPIADGLHQLHLPFGLAQALATEPAVQIAFGVGFGGLLAVLVGMAIPALITSRSLGAVQDGLPASVGATQEQLNNACTIKGVLGNALQKYALQTRSHNGTLVSSRSAALYLGRTGLGFGMFRLLPMLIFMLGLIVCVYAVTQAIDNQLHATGDTTVMMLGFRAAGSALFFTGVAACFCWLIMQLIEARLAGQLVELGQNLDSLVPVIAESSTNSVDNSNEMYQHLVNIKHHDSASLQQMHEMGQTYQQANTQLLEAVAALSVNTQSFDVASADLAGVAKMSHETVDKFITLAERMSELQKQISATAAQPASVSTMPYSKPVSDMPLANAETANRLSSAIKNLRDAAATETLPEL